MALNGFHVVCLEPGADNPKKHAPVPAPEPPEGFVDNTVKVFRLNPDGSKGELVRFNPRTREGCDAVCQGALLRGRMFQSTHPRGVRPINGKTTLE